MSELNAVGVDATSVNTGIHTGVIARLEQEVQRELQRIVCLLHFTELPLRELFVKLDGKTTGPKTGSG